MTGCLKTKVRQGTTTDERVINLLALAEERKICGQGILKWYAGVKQARDAKSQMVATTTK